MIGITKQGFYRRLIREKAWDNKKEKIIEIATHIRGDHKKMGCRKMYTLIGPRDIGRDRTEQILLDNGFRLPRKRSYHRTTYAGKKFYKNLISDRTITGKNRLYVSDITYIPMGYNRHYYLTLVLDVYTRVIKGWALSDTMRVEDTVEPAFLMAIKGLEKAEAQGLIFHSDKGAQYGSDQMKIHYHSTGVQPSMGGKAWENAHAESLNGILKNEYINFENVEVPLNVAKKMMIRWVWLYNNERPHGSLNKMKPTEFENYVEQLSNQYKPAYKINY